MFEQELTTMSGKKFDFIADALLTYRKNLLDFNTNVTFSLPMHLENDIKQDNTPPVERSVDEMPKISQSVNINGQKVYLRANTAQELVDKVIQLASSSTPPPTRKHPFAAYATNWFEIYSKPNIATSTATTYQRQLRLYLIPFFGEQPIEDITPDDVQRLFNQMTGTKATKNKVKEVLSQVLDAAIEDELLVKNPLKSKRVRITGTASEHTKPYTQEQMQYIVQHLGDIKDPVDRMYMALQALHPFRLEEVLGLQAEDIDLENRIIHIQRAVTHPDRNRPEVKETKTESSNRTLPIVPLALPYLLTVPDGQFLIGGEKPISYTQVRHMRERIKKDIAFDEDITPIRFRTTVLSDLYDQTKDIKLTQAAAGHTTSAMTLKYYVNQRAAAAETAAAIERAYAPKVADQLQDPESQTP